MDDDEGLSVAYRLALLSCDPQGHPGLGVRVLDRMARIGLLADLALGEYVDVPSGLADLDVTAIGRPYDRCVEFFDQNADAEVADFVERGDVAMVDVLDAAGIGRPTWNTVRSRVLPLDQIDAERLRIRAVVDGVPDPDPATASVISLAEGVGFVPVEPAGAFRSRCAAASDLVAEGAELLARLADRAVRAQGLGGYTFS